MGNSQLFNVHPHTEVVPAEEGISLETDPSEWQTACQTAPEHSQPHPYPSLCPTESTDDVDSILTSPVWARQCSPHFTFLPNSMLGVNLVTWDSGQIGTRNSKMQGNSDLHTKGRKGGASSVSNQSESSEDSRSNQQRDEVEDENDELEQFARSKRKRKVPTKLFACPYFKHSPWQFCSSRSCSGPGWMTVHRVKEHLFRRHRRPIICPRCHNDFDSHQALSLHLQLERRCEIISASRHMLRLGMDEPQALAIKSRRKIKGFSDEERWRQMYQILFPDAAHIPCPYYEESDLGYPNGKDQETIVDEFATYQEQQGIKKLREILSEELLRLHPTMEEEVARAIGRVQQAYKKIAADFFRERALPTTSLGSASLCSENTSAGLASSYPQSERENSAAHDIESTYMTPQSWESMIPSLSPASTEPSSCASSSATFVERTADNLYTKPGDYPDSAESFSELIDFNWSDSFEDRSFGLKEIHW